MACVLPEVMIMKPNIIGHQKVILLEDRGTGAILNHVFTSIEDVREYYGGEILFNEAMKHWKMVHFNRSSSW